MTFEQEVAAALVALMSGGLQAGGDVDDPEAAAAELAPRVAAAIEAYGRTELPSETIRALFGETQRWYVNGVEYATMGDAEAALVTERRALREAAALRALLGGPSPHTQEPR